MRDVAQKARNAVLLGRPNVRQRPAGFEDFTQKLRGAAFGCNDRVWGVSGDRDAPAYLIMDDAECP
jgi:hypothetical protein